MNKKTMMMTTVAGALALLATGCVTDSYYTTRETYCTPAYVETVYPTTYTYTRVDHYAPPPPRHTAVPRHEVRRDHVRYSAPVKHAAKPAKHTTKPAKHATTPTKHAATPAGHTAKPAGHAAKPVAKQKPAAMPARKHRG